MLFHGVYLASALEWMFNTGHHKSFWMLMTGPRISSSKTRRASGISFLASNSVSIRHETCPTLFNHFWLAWFFHKYSNTYIHCNNHCDIPIYNIHQKYTVCYVCIDTILISIISQSYKQHFLYICSFNTSGIPFFFTKNGLRHAAVCLTSGVNRGSARRNCRS